TRLRAPPTRLPAARAAADPLPLLPAASRGKTRGRTLRSPRDIRPCPVADRVPPAAPPSRPAHRAAAPKTPPDSPRPGTGNPARSPPPAPCPPPPPPPAAPASSRSPPAPVSTEEPPIRSYRVPRRDPSQRPKLTPLISYRFLCALKALQSERRSQSPPL